MAPMLIGGLVVSACGSAVPSRAAVELPSTSAAANVGAAPAAPVVVSRLAVLGDIACDPTSSYYNGGVGDTQHCRQRAVGRLVRGLHVDYVITTGDNQYEKGGLAAYNASYDAALGAVRSRTWPVPGNHEYATSGAAGYFEYFGTRAGSPTKPWRAMTPARGWRVVLLDSNCWAVGGCGRTSPQARWLASRLNKSPTRCTIASWHHPLFTAGAYKGNADVQAAARPLWAAADRGGVDIVVHGHDHNYQRFAKTDGMVEFVAGAGGKSHYGLTTAPRLRFGNDETFGVLVLTLRSDGSYRHAFVTVDGRRLDVGTGGCSNPRR